MENLLKRVKLIKLRLYLCRENHYSGIARLTSKDIFTSSPHLRDSTFQLSAGSFLPLYCPVSEISATFPAMVSLVFW